MTSKISSLFGVLGAVGIMVACVASDPQPAGPSDSIATEDTAGTASRDDPYSSGRVIGAGATALFTCSGYFIAGRTQDELLALELSEVDGVPLEAVSFPWNAEIDADRRLVKMNAGGEYEPMFATYRDDLGCTLLPYGETPESWQTDTDKFSRRSPVQIRDKMFPEEVLSPDDESYAQDVMSVVDAAFDTGTYNPNTRTLGIVVLHEGQLVAERYRDGFGPGVQYRSWSSAKSITNALVGVALREGIIDGLDEPVDVDAWASDDPRKAITLRNLLHMASGLETENPGEGNQTFAVYFAGADFAQLAPQQPLVAEPGTRYHYSNYDTLLLMHHLRQTLADDVAYVDFPYSKLLDRIGMADTVMEQDGYGNYISSSQVYTTPRDLSRLGLLFLNDGVWNGDRLLPEGWVDFSCTPNGLREDGRYGAHWWIAKTGETTANGDAIDICYANGARGQHVAFAPQLDLVIARMGVDSLNTPDWYFDETRFFADVAKVIQARTTSK